MPKKSTTTIAAILGVGVVLVALILRTKPGARGGEEGGAEAAGPLAYPRGSHGGRLLSDGPLQLEITIYETGVPPQFRIYPLDASQKPVAPAQVDLQVELHRLGGRVDRIGFRPEADYLRGDSTVEEPHSFDVTVKASHGGRRFEWTYSQIEGKVKLDAEQRASAGIVIDTVRSRRMVTTLELPGEVKADETRRAQVVARLKGLVADAFKKEGDRVRKGELLAILSSRELAAAKSEYLAAARHVEFTRVALEREEALWKKKISAERDYLEARRVFDEATLAEKLAAEGLVVLGVPAASLPGLATAPAETLARFELRSPLDGTVTVRDVTVGEAVTAEQALFVVTDLSSVWVDVSVYASDLAAVHEGQEVTIRSADLGSEVSGRISYFGPLVGEQTRAATARIVIANAGGRWRPGLFVTVRLVREATVIPVAVATEALQTFRDWQVVFIRSGDWFEARPLELGRSDGAWVEVRHGLKPGEEYASRNSFAVKAEIGKLGATHDH